MSGNGPGDSVGPRPLVVVLGMHRSGTSGLARVLHACGVEAPRDLMPPGPDNPDGFWESPVLVGIADELLAEQGMSWDSLGQPPSGWVRSAVGRAFVVRYQDALAEQFPADGPILLKDPRLCRLVSLVDAASDALGLAARFAIPFRHPWEVADSLRARNDLALERGVALWLDHCLAAEHATRGAPRAFVSYGDLLADWREIVRRLRGALDLPLSPGRAGTAADLDREISSGRRHHVAGEGPWGVPDELRRRAERCHQALMQLAEGRDPQVLLDLDRLREEVAATNLLLVPVARDLEGVARRERERRDVVQGHLTHAEHVIEDLRSRLQDRRELEERSRLLAERVQTLEERNRGVEARLQGVREGNRRLEERGRQLEQSIRGLREGNRKLEERGRALEVRSRGFQKEIRDLERVKLALEGHLEAERERFAIVWNSYSMRLTHPLRMLRGAWAKGRAGVNGGFGTWARRLFRALPLSDHHRAALRDRMAGWRNEAGTVDGRSPHGQGPEPRIRDGRHEGESESIRARIRRETDAELDAFLASGELLQLPATSASPRLSVILVLFNQAPLTLACLKALGRSEFRDFEVVLVDNASSDRTSELLERIRPARVIRNGENRHFLRGCNQAVREATGEYVLFLNNDTRVAPEAIGSALAVFDEEDRVGAVGGRLVLPDGTLQEAGSIVWSDGSCLGYGRGEDPSAPQFAFRRDVDYCSAAFLITPRVLLDFVGPFDERFAPAYYEETDYCIGLWENGFRVIYEPRAVIEHFEFASATREGGTRLSRLNQDLFFRKHEKRLASHLDPHPSHVISARSARRDAPKVLFVEDRFPHRRLGSGFPRANHLVREMLDLGCEVTLYATNEPRSGWDEVYADLPRQVECIRGDRGRGLKRLLGTRKGYFHTVFVSRPHNMAALNDVLEGDPELLDAERIVYDAEALFALREIARRECRGSPPGADERSGMIRSEVELARLAHAIVTVSESEAEHFRQLDGKEVFVLGHVLEPVPGPRSFSEREGFLFVGAFHDEVDPNTDSMVWFVKEVWPLLRKDPRVGGSSLRIVGRNPSPPVQALGRHPGVEIVGAVDLTQPYYDEARLCVIPTRYAAGVPYKAHEAAAHGVPMVVTDLIAGQLGWDHEKELLRGRRDGPAEFAEMCVRLYSDAELWDRVRIGALRRIEGECSSDHSRKVLAQALGRTRPAIDRAPGLDRMPAVRGQPAVRGSGS